MVGRSLGSMRLRRRYGVYPLAVHRRNQNIGRQLDDVIVRASVSTEFSPPILHFEVSHLTPGRLRKVLGFLYGCGYEASRQGPDLLAIKSLGEQDSPVSVK
jgi:hypothetical protein